MLLQPLLELLDPSTHHTVKVVHFHLKHVPQVLEVELGGVEVLHHEPLLVEGELAPEGLLHVLGPLEEPWQLRGREQGKLLVEEQLLVQDKRDEHCIHYELDVVAVLYQFHKERSHCNLVLVVEETFGTVELRLELGKSLQNVLLVELEVNLQLLVKFLPRLHFV